jgi:capsular exopolysaccharide synthesis family protein
MKATKGDLARRLVTVEEPASIASEAYRAMRANLFNVLTDPRSMVVVLTSPNPKEGRSTICANLGVVVAQAGKRTLVADCDMRKPALHKVFGLRNSRGLVDVLVDEYELQEVLHEPFPNLKVLTAGPIPHNPTELLSSESFAQLVDQARQNFDFVLMDSSHVLIDSSTIGPSADPIIVAAQVDGVLLVLDGHTTSIEALRQATRALEAVGANILGTVLNNAEYGRLT